ncbi:unnamed protein product, partial [Ranitomeya imitator]
SIPTHYYTRLRPHSLPQEAPSPTLPHEAQSPTLPHDAPYPHITTRGSVPTHYHMRLRPPHYHMRLRPHTLPHEAPLRPHTLPHEAPSSHITTRGCVPTHYHMRLCPHKLPYKALSPHITTRSFIPTHYHMRLHPHTLPHEAASPHITTRGSVLTHYHTRLRPHTLPHEALAGDGTGIQTQNQTCLDRGQIINRSQYVLSRDEYGILQKGLNFVPTNRYNCFGWFKDLNLFCRKLKWKKFFKHHNSEECLQQGIQEEDWDSYQDLVGLLAENEQGAATGKGPFTALKNRSSRMPPQMDTSNIDIFLQLVERDLRRIGNGSQDIDYNLTEGEKQALEALRNNDQLIIKSSDKGGNLVIMEHQTYRDMCYRILQDSNTYEVLKYDPMDIYKERL